MQTNKNICSRILTPKQVGPKTGRCILIRNRDYYFYKGYI